MALVRPLPPGVDLFALASRFPERYPHLLETALTGQAPARFSLLMAFPGITVADSAAAVFAVLDQLPLVSESKRAAQAVQATNPVQPTQAAQTAQPTQVTQAAQPTKVAQLTQAAQVTPATQIDAGSAWDLPFLGGWFFYLGYETAWSLEPSLGQAAVDPWLPTALATAFPAALILDHWTHSLFFVDEQEDSPRLQQVLADLECLAATPVLDDTRNSVSHFTLEEDPPSTYLAAVRRALAYIRDGDCFQANLSREWRACSDQPVVSAALYQQLRHANPAPFAAWLSLPGADVLSSSPERLVAVVDGRVETRPIAGTRRRDPDQQRDIDLSQELRINSKEIAEHIMLVDLERNDLGRIARIGSVEVAELMTIESYRRVHHIVSSVCADLRPEITVGAVLRATFPGGTITGCPKIRSMQIIQELEGGVARGAYTGTCGYFSHHGRMDSNILIRTLVVRGQHVRFRTGAGIVADSDPERELAETRHKAHALLDCLHASGVD